jgi:hypothetical protein
MSKFGNCGLEIAQTWSNSMADELQMNEFFNL